jgi:hypothetical protein
MEDAKKYTEDLSEVFVALPNELNAVAALERAISRICLSTLPKKRRPKWLERQW